MAHVLLSLTAAKVPGLHGVGASEPVEQNDPAGQEVHCSAAPSPAVLLNVPVLHGSGADAPASQYEPATHS